MVTPRRLWLIGGTEESAVLAAQLATAQVACTVTVTTEAARTLYPHSPLVKVRVGILDLSNLSQFLLQESIAVILDASHPFAMGVSQMAIQAARQYGFPYLRYERPAPKTPSPWVRPIITLEALLKRPPPAERVLLMVGARWLSSFRVWQGQAHLFARILPTLKAMAIAQEAGFASRRLIALRPPVSYALEQALWRQWAIEAVVLKASGGQGEAIKHDVSRQLKIPMYVIQRPRLAFPRQSQSLTETLRICIADYKTRDPKLG